MQQVKASIGHDQFSSTGILFTPGGKLLVANDLRFEVQHFEAKLGQARPRRKLNDDAVSETPQGPLRISAGRTFSIIPRSTSQTSPRFATFFLLIQKSKHLPGAFGDIFVAQWLIAIQFRGMTLPFRGAQ